MSEQPEAEKSMRERPSARQEKRGSKITRREFLKTAGRVAVAAGLAALVSSEVRTPRTTHKTHTETYTDTDRDSGNTYEVDVTESQTISPEGKVIGRAGSVSSK